jgi:hypothetical protein
MWAVDHRPNPFAIACILEPAVTRKILRHLGLPHEPPASSSSRAPPVLEFA